MQSQKVLQFANIMGIFIFYFSQSFALLSVCLHLVTPGLVLSGKSLFVGKSVGHGFMLHFVQGRRLNTSSRQAVSAYSAEGNYCSLSTPSLHAQTLLSGQWRSLVLSCFRVTRPQPGCPAVSSEDLEGHTCFRVTWICPGCPGLNNEDQRLQEGCHRKNSE